MVYDGYSDSAATTNHHKLPAARRTLRCQSQMSNGILNIHIAGAFCGRMFGSLYAPPENLYSPAKLFNQNQNF